jgi:hypothetical protein
MAGYNTSRGRSSRPTRHRNELSEGVFTSEESFACAGIEADNYFIFPNGRVYRCPLCEDFPFHSLVFNENQLVSMPKINEADLFPLIIPEGCVMNKIIQPGNIQYASDGTPTYKIACCMLKEEIR